MKRAVGSGDGNAIDSQVGGRQACLRLAPGGGGYPDICMPTDAALSAPARAADPRLAELRRVGLPRIWITVAQAIGFDAFVAMWRVLMQGGHVDDRCRVVVPNYSRYLRFQRNQLIKQLIAEGFGVAEIRDIVYQTTGETISESHIRRSAPKA
jgi:hypothetical protein